MIEFDLSCVISFGIGFENGFSDENATMETITQKTNLKEIRKNNFESEVLLSNVPVLLEFGASWCGPCHIIAPGINKLAVEYIGRVKFGLLDIDEDIELKVKYGVRDLPTIILFKNGIVEDFIVGTKPTLEIKSRLDELLLKV